MDSSDQQEEVEANIKQNYKKLKAGFEQLEKLADAKKPALLKELTVIMQDCKREIKDYEREARMNNMPPKELSEKKRQLVQELNTYIGYKKATQAQLQARNNLFDGATTSKAAEEVDKLSNQQLIEMGTKEIAETDRALERARQVVEDTIQIGAQTAATLNDQTKQMEGILNDLDDITFNMKKAQKVIGDITRGLATDKCILCLVCLIVVGIIVGIVVVSVVNNAPPAPPAPPPPSIPGAGTGLMPPPPPPPPPAVSGRRLLY